MKKYLVFSMLSVVLGCAHPGVSSWPTEEKARQYSSTAVTISDFSMKIVAYYQSQNLSVPKDFDTKQFFTLLGKIYPDQRQVQSIQNNYRVDVRGLDGGYSVMLCDPQTDQKIMEDLSCHLNRVEIQPWQNNVGSPCVFENNWKSHCE